MADRRRQLRKGYTTGACATAATKAAAQALLKGSSISEVEVTFPRGEVVSFHTEYCTVGEGWAEASVIKDAGDDPDITHGAQIVSRVSWVDSPGLILEGGEGVGKITKPGIGLPVGEPAINPTPRKMIAQAIAEVMNGTTQKRGVRVVVSVPGGLEMAKKTLNDRLGIVGGISILGTTGIVVPYSTAAYRASVTQAISVAAAAGCKHVVLTTGGRSERFAQKYITLPTEGFIEMGDFVGHSLRACVKQKMEKITICGMIGKLSKIAVGHFQTHAAGSQVDTLFLSTIAEELGASPDIVKEIRENTTARFFSEEMIRLGMEQAFTNICQLVCEQSRQFVKDALAMECILTDFEEGIILGRASIG